MKSETLPRVLLVILMLFGALKDTPTDSWPLLPELLRSCAKTVQDKEFSGEYDWSTLGAPSQSPPTIPHITLLIIKRLEKLLNLTYHMIENNTYKK